MCLEVDISFNEHLNNTRLEPVFKNTNNMGHSVLGLYIRRTLTKSELIVPS